MVLLSVLGYRRKWVTQTIRYCDLSPHWLLRAPGPPPRPRAAGIRAAAGAGRQQSHCSAQGSLPHPRCHRLTSDANTATAAAACALSHRLPADRGVMGFWKLSPFLAIGLLVMYQAGMLQAAPFRSALENPLESATLTEDEICVLLTAVVKDYVQMKARELQQEQETEGSSPDSFRAKWCSNLSTCVLGTYTQDLNKFHTFPQTAIGVGAPGKKRVLASSLERDHRPHIGMIQDAY